MNLPSAEAQLMALALAFYLWDSARLLHVNEAALQAGRAGRWRALFGARQVRLRGKELLLPNPLTPHRPLYLLSWTLPAAAPAGPAAQATAAPTTGASAAPAAPAPAAKAMTGTVAWEQDAARYRGLQPFILLSGLSLFGLLPLSLFARLGDVAALASLGLMYLGIAGASVWLLRHRRALDLPPGRWRALLLEGLLCPPLALNLLRKLALAHSPQEDFTQAVRRLLPEPAQSQALAQCALRVDEELEGEDGDSPRAQALQNTRTLLLGSTRENP